MVYALHFDAAERFSGKITPRLVLLYLTNTLLTFFSTFVRTLRFLSCPPKCPRGSWECLRFFLLS